MRRGEERRGEEAHLQYLGVDVIVARFIEKDENKTVCIPSNSLLLIQVAYLVGLQLCISFS